MPRGLDLRGDLGLHHPAGDRQLGVSGSEHAVLDNAALGRLVIAAHQPAQATEPGVRHPGNLHSVAEEDFHGFVRYAHGTVTENRTQGGRVEPQGISADGAVMPAAR